MAQRFEKGAQRCFWSLDSLQAVVILPKEEHNKKFNSQNRKLLQKTAEGSLSMSQLAPVIVLGIFVIIFGIIIEVVASLCGIRGKKDPVKSESYECGLPSDTSGPTRIPIKFYLTAILFILFDIEIIFMYPWAITYGDFISNGLGAYILAAMGFFIAVFVFGLFWEVKSKALEWE